MAYGTKYQLYFDDVDGNEHHINILYKDYAGAVTDISEQGYASPFIINIKETPPTEFIVGQGATMRFYKGSIDFSDLFTVDPFGIRVDLYGLGGYLEWSGFVSVESYYESFSDDDPMIEVTLNDGMAGLERTPYYSEVGNPLEIGLLKVGDVIKTILAPLNHSYIVVVGNLLEAASTNVYNFFNHYVDGANYVDEDFKSMTMRGVLEELLKTYHLTYWNVGRVIFLYNRSACYYSGSLLTYYKFNAALTLLGSGTFDNRLLRSVPDYHYLNASQSKTLMPGYNKIFLKYNPYPHHLWYWDDLNDVADWDVPNWVEVTKNMFVSWDTPNPDVADYGLTFQDSSVEYNASQGGKLFQIANNSDATKGDKAIGVYYPVEDGVTDVVNIAGGNVWANGDTLGIGVKVNFADGIYNPIYQGNPSNKKVTRFIFRCQIKIGNKWAVQDGTSNVLNMTGSSASNCDITVDNVSESVVNEWMDCVIYLKSITESGHIAIKIYDYIRIYAEDNAEIFPSIYSFLLFKDFEALPGEKPIDDSPIESEAYTSVNYVNELKVDLIHSDKRVGGCLDRGMLWGNITTPTSQWKLVGESLYKPHRQMLARYYLSQFTGITKKVTATIDGLTLFGGRGYSITNFYKGILCPLSVIIDNNIGGQVMVAGGNIDVQSQEFTDGVFYEVKPVTEDIS